MPKIKYKSFRFSDASLRVIAQANRILGEYAGRGIIVTLRQLYYQFVARDIIPNKQREYKRLGSIINDARLAGMIDWNFLQDRTRNLQELSTWDQPDDIIRGAAESYRRDLWLGQENYAEVWIEKDALVGVIEGICDEWDVPYFSCRGYTSQSEMWAASQRLLKRVRAGQSVHVIHLGDHDPSGKDMSRDIRDRLGDFLSYHLARDYAATDKVPPQGESPERKAWEERAAVWLAPRMPVVNRIALTIEQVREYNPPPNPAKITDSRANGYIEEFGAESWELDALDPDVLVGLIRTAIEELVDRELWDAQRERQEREREVLTAASENWEGVREFLGYQE